MEEQPQFGHIQEIDLNNLTPRLHNNCWVVADARKFLGQDRYRSLVQNGAIWSEDNAQKMAEELNKMIYRNLFGLLSDSMTETKGPFYAYRLQTAKDLGLLPKKQVRNVLLITG